MDMRHSWLFLINAAVLLASQTACRQTSSNSQFAPIGPLTPVGGNTAAAALSPLGQPTRVAPPPTGAFSTPNNYLGGAAAPGGQAYHPQGSPAYDSFSSVPNGTGIATGQTTVDSGVAPTSWSAPVGGHFPSDVAPTSGLMAPGPRMGGMRVIDMTQSPPPPGYFQYQSPAPQAYPQAYPQAPPGYPAQNPGGFAPLPMDAEGVHVQPMVQFPGAGEIASQQSPQAPPRIQPNLGSGQGNVLSESPMQPAVMEPSFRAASQFPTGQPSTDPVGSDFENQADNLPWRRPEARY